MSFIVQRSVEMGSPIVAVSINYRLHMWGFLWSAEVKEAGAGNLGFRDQRLALEWTNQNIAAFGGDPAQVTIWGESAGARSVASQLLAYDGRDDGLFKGAIQQSGTGLTSMFTDIPVEGDPWQEYYDDLVDQTNCTDADDSLQCLREIDAWTLNDILNATSANPGIGRYADGDFLTAPRDELIRDGKFLKVPLLIGTNFDEGTAQGTAGINTTEEWNAYLAKQGADNETIAVLSALYPDVPSLGIPATLDSRPEGSAAKYGSMWKRVASVAGDMNQQAGRRWVSRHYALADVPCYTYHFNVLVNGLG